MAEDYRVSTQLEQNPYAAPQSQVLQSSTSDEVIRREHINTEATIKSVGALYYLGALFLPLAGVFSVVEGLKKNDTAQLVGGFSFWSSESARDSSPTGCVG